MTDSQTDGQTDAAEFNTYMSPCFVTSPGTTSWRLFLSVVLVCILCHIASASCPLPGIIRCYFRTLLAVLFFFRQRYIAWPFFYCFVWPSVQCIITVSRVVGWVTLNSSGQQSCGVFKWLLSHVCILLHIEICAFVFWTIACDGKVFNFPFEKQEKRKKIAFHFVLRKYRNFFFIKEFKL